MPNKLSKIDSSRWEDHFDGPIEFLSSIFWLAVAKNDISMVHMIF